MTSIDEVLQECHSAYEVVSVDNLCFDQLLITGFMVHMITITQEEFSCYYEWDGEKYLDLTSDAV